MPRQKLLDRPGVYAIRNRENGKVYVGSSVNISKRWSEHRASLAANRNVSRHLQHAYNKYGFDAFEWIVLEHCGADELLEREQYWSDEYRSYNADFGYNLRTTVGSSLGVKLSEDTRLKMSEASLGKPKSLLHRLNMSLGKKGHDVSDETKAKISATKAQKYADGWRPSFVPDPGRTPPDVIAEVRRLLAEGHSYRAIGRMLNLDHHTVSRIDKGKLD